MASGHLTSDRPKRLLEIQADEHDAPHGSGYQSSDGSDRIPRDTNNVLTGTRDGSRPPKKHCLPPPPPVPPRYKCGTCKTLFDAYEDVARHIRADSIICAASDGHWMCGKCNETFTEGKSLERHVITTGCASVTTRPSYACQSCGKPYTRKDNLQRHEKSHQGHSRRKNAKTKTISSSISVESSPHTTGDSITTSHGDTSSAQSSESAKILRSCGTHDLDLQLPYVVQPTDCSLTPVTPNDRPSTMSTMPSVGMVASNRHIPLPNSTSTAQLEIPPKFSPPRNSMNLPLRPKHANKRPGPKIKSTKCPSCHKTVGTSQQELEAHAKSHSDGRYSVNLLCMKCMICFEREEDLRHHETSANEYGNCGFLDHKNCGGHHPLAGEVSANPTSDHARMRDAVQNWQLLGLQDYQLRHDEVIEALPDQGEDCERWTWTARSLKGSSLWSQHSRPLSKMSALTNTDYSARTPFRNIADRYQQVKDVAASRNRNKTLQIKRRADLATVGAIMTKDFTTLAQMLHEGRNPNAHLDICDTGAARIKYNEKLKKTHDVISPLILASEQGYLDGMSMLICAGADVNAVDVNCRTALDWAMTRHNKLACAVLLAHGARYVERGDRLVDEPHVFLQSAKNELISTLVYQHRTRSHADPFACYAHHAILNADEDAFRHLLSFGFSLDSRPLCICAEHGCRSFRDMAKNAAPHLLNILPQKVDLELLTEAISTNDVYTIKTLLTPTTILPLFMCSGDVLLDSARKMPGVSQEVLDVLASAIEGVALSRPPQESFWYSRVMVTDCG